MTWAFGLTTWLISAWLTPLAATEDGHLTVGLLAPRGEAHAEERWQDTLERLNQGIPGYSFAGRPMTLDGIMEAVAEGQVDFVLTNPGQFILLETPYSLSWLATLRAGPTGSAREALGSVMLVREDSRFRHPRELGNRRVVAVNEQAFGGYLLLLPSLEAHGTRVERFNLDFLGYPIDALMYQLRDGQADAAIVPVCLLEEMTREGLLQPGQFRALMGTDDLNGCKSSTPGYPDWTFAALPHVPESLAGEVARTLLNTEPSMGSGWGAPVSSAKVARLFNDLSLHPLRESLPDRIITTLQRYWHYSLAGILTILSALAYHAWVQRRAYHQARALESTQLTLRERERALASQQSRNISGELATTLAHEINQPLSAIRHYAEGGLLRLQKIDPDSPLIEPLEKIGNEAERSAAIIAEARHWIKAEAPALEPITLNTLFEDARAMHAQRLERAGIRLELDVEPSRLEAKANRLAMEQVLSNLLSNSIDAFAESGQGGWIDLTARMLPGPEASQVLVRLRDNAGGFTHQRLETPFMPLESTRQDGLGLGLVICQRLMQRQGGRIELDNHAHGGAEIRLTLPAATRTPSS